MQAFEWLPSECAHERHPMQLIRGQLFRGEDDIVRVPVGKIVNNGLGHVGSRRIVGDPLKPVPDRLELAWFSYVEDQFFAGELELPASTMAELFSAGYFEPKTNEKVTWSKLIVGMSLGGWACVWLEGSGLSRLITSAQLESAELDWTEVVDNPDVPRDRFIRDRLREQLSGAVLRTLDEQGTPPPVWPRYARPAPWLLRAEGVRVPLTIDLHNFDGERYWYDVAKQPPQQQHAVPKRLQITWLSSSGRKLLSNIDMNETEVFDAFERVAAAAEPGDAPPTLRVDCGPRSQISLSLDSARVQEKLTRATIERFSLKTV